MADQKVDSKFIEQVDRLVVEIEQLKNNQDKAIILFVKSSKEKGTEMSLLSKGIPQQEILSMFEIVKYKILEQLSSGIKKIE